MKLEFIKNILSVNVDAQKEVNHYVVKAMYNEIGGDGFATITCKLVDEFNMTWEEIEGTGGISQVNKDLKRRYGV